MKLNKLLLRQIQKYHGGVENIPTDFHKILGAISESYDHYERDHNLLERTIGISSNEMMELNTELREETKKLAAADHNLRMLFENIDETFFSVDMRSFKLLHMSQTCEIVYGYKPEDFFITTTLWQDVIHPEDRHISEQQLHELYSGKKVQNQYRIIHRDKSVRWVENKIIPTLDKFGKLSRIDGITSDITERKHAEELLIKSEANLRNIFENTETAYVLLDKNANIISFNPVAKEMGLKELDNPLAGNISYINLMPANKKVEVRQKINDVLAKGERIKYESAYTQKDGSVKWYYISLHPILRANNEILGLSVAATDITERKKREVQIKLSNERYKLVLKATKDVIWDWDFRNDRIYRSVNYTQLLGSTENKLTQSWVEAIHPEDRERVQLSIMHKINHPGATLWEDQYRSYKSNGELVYIHDRAYIVRDSENRPVRMVGAMSNITLEKTLSIERDKITSDLIQRNRDLEQFSFIVSHNLRLPVANIMGLVNLIQNNSQLSEADAKRCLDGLFIASTKLDGVIKDLNHILQVRNDLNEKKGLILFSELVEDIKVSIQNLLEAEEATIETNFQEVDKMFTLKSYIHSIFFNLISNSIKYRNGQAPRIQISSRKVDGNIILVFKDNSLGIDLSTQANKVFGLYNKFHFHKEGKGIGLYMTKTQVEILGGKIDVKSTVDHGTEFTIEFQE